MSGKNNLIETAHVEPKTLLLSAYWWSECQLDQEHFIQEFVSLVNTAELVDPAHEMVQFRYIIRKPASANFLTKGKLAELVELCRDGEFERIVCSLKLTAVQKRNLEDLTECQVMDRNDLILAIFKRAAVTAEGRIQVRMAEIELLKTRMSGIGEEMGQQQAGAMARGPGETIKEYQHRFYRKIFGQAKRELETLQKARQIQRKRRISGAKPILSIVGYTNAGKSSLINALTSSSTLVEDKLFATLDTTTKELFLASPDKKVLISDTIGFISNIPHNLIEAFKSTLDELRYADALLHVVDISNPAWRDQIRIVNETLEEIEVFRPMIYVFNKTDNLSKKELTLLRREISFSDLKPNVFVSVHDKTNFETLKRLIKKINRSDQKEV